ncbi:Uracil-DNA glycosylase [Balamuthia mandrillaris]
MAKEFSEELTVKELLVRLREQGHESEAETIAEVLKGVNGGKRKRASTKKAKEEEEEEEPTTKKRQRRTTYASTTAKKGRASAKGKQKKTASDEEEEAAENEKEEAEEGEGEESGDLLSYFNEGTWKELLRGEFEKPYFKKLVQFVEQEYAENPGEIYPPKKDLFNAFNSTPFEEVKVVVLGQDPYYRKGQAHGLSFSVQRGVKVPPSLNRIYAEISENIAGFKKPNHGYLQKWAEEGVLLLNATLSVKEGKPNAHASSGWQQFTDAAIKCLNNHSESIVYMLWGGFAQKKSSLITSEKHHVLTAAHPSPMSGGAWKGNKHFSKANELLAQSGRGA